MICAVGAAGWLWLRPLAEAQSRAADALPDEVKLRRQRQAALVGLSLLTVVIAGILLLATRAWAVAGSALALLAALWFPWYVSRILAALVLLCAALAAALAALLILAGGPDARGGPPGGVLAAIAVGVLVLLACVVALIHAELSLRRAPPPGGPASDQA